MESDSNNKAEDDKGRKEEEIKAITTRQLCDYFKEINKKPISTDNLKHTYLNPLINEGIIDYTESKINLRQNIYYPLVTESLSIESITSPIDNYSQYILTIHKKITKNIDETWIFCEILRLIRYRLEWGNMSLFEYIKDPDKFQIVDKRLLKKGDHNADSIGEKDREATIIPITIGAFTKKYCYICHKAIDNKRSNILLDFAKNSPFLSSLRKIDSIDNIDTNTITKNMNEEKVCI